MSNVVESNKTYFTCELCELTKKGGYCKSQIYKSLFRLQWHVSYHHVNSIEKMVYKEKLAKLRRKDRS